MYWKEYYDRFYDWSENIEIMKLSDLEALGPADQVTEIIAMISTHRPDISERIARMALAQKISFSGDDLARMSGFVNEELVYQLLMQSAGSFSEKDFAALEKVIDPDILRTLRGLDSQDETSKDPAGVFSATPYAFNNHEHDQLSASNNKPRKRSSELIKVEEKDKKTFYDLFSGCMNGNNNEKMSYDTCRYNAFLDRLLLAIGNIGIIESVMKAGVRV
ncbi:hypothetical protein [Candidatus Weimeria sp. HCP3S3_B5]|uniref:hypothetical protein n=1 Tax=Candidatus Weimeria sp. HCP3S3_B5 TaxID=3438871 RepID=UPI003F89F973